MHERIAFLSWQTLSVHFSGAFVEVVFKPELAFSKVLRDTGGGRKVGADTMVGNGRDRRGQKLA